MIFLHKTASSSIVPNLPATWTPWDPSPTFLQQKHSLTSQSQQAPSLQNRIAKYLRSLTTTTNPPLRRHQTMPTRSENVDCSTLERSLIKAKRKALNATFSSKSLTTDNDRNEIPFLGEHKYFSNSLNCLNMKDL